MNIVVRVDVAVPQVGGRVPMGGAPLGCLFLLAAAWPARYMGSVAIILVVDCMGVPLARFLFDLWL